MGIEILVGVLEKRQKKKQVAEAKKLQSLSDGEVHQV